MKVLYINMGDEHVAGSERSMLELIAAGSAEIDAHVLCNSPALAEATRQLAHEATVAELVELSPYGTPPWPVRAFWAGVRAVVACIEKFRPALIHANNVWPTQLAVAAAVFRHVPVVGHVRATTFRSGRDLSLMRLADHIVAVSETTARPFGAMRLRRGPVSVVFDPVHVEPPPAVGRPGGGQTVRLAVAGRLSTEKAVDRAIDLLASLRAEGLDAELTIFGDGPQRATLERCVEKTGLREAVEFAGFCDDLPRRLSRADALLLPSLREALPRVIVEAGMVAVPTIAVPVGGIAEVVDSGRCGLLVEDFESSASRQAILGLLRSPDRLREMGRRMQEFCFRHFTPAKAFARTWDVYRQVLRGRRARPATRRPQP